jgi:hypothetical protein
MPSEVMDCFTAFAMTATFTMTRLFMASEAWQSMNSDCMDCRALACPEFIEGLAVTIPLFKVRVR